MKAFLKVLFTIIGFIIVIALVVAMENKCACKNNSVYVPVAPIADTQPAKPVIKPVVSIPQKVTKKPVKKTFTTKTSVSTGCNNRQTLYVIDSYEDITHDDIETIIQLDELSE